MIPRIIIRPAADRDLDEQADYLARRSLESAARWYDAAASTLEFLARNSEIGPLRETRRPELAGIRTWAVDGFPKHVIFYRPMAEGIEVLRVLHGARDIDRILGGD